MSRTFPRGIGPFLAYAKNVAARMAGNPYVPSPPVPLATLLAHIADFDAALVASLSRARGSAKARDAKREIVESDLRQLCSYVETVANQYPDEGPLIIASSGMSAKGKTGPRKTKFAVKPGKTSDSVRLVVIHPGIVTQFDWQYSSDGTLWIDAPRTVWAHQELEGLTPGTRYFFRYRTLTRDGLSAWSDALTMIVG